eukprot:CAMPEP_0201594836 /NCGR_PEP_ID=MMETSP0190_2-20130828/192033_1 /ASSEMBLY_ACC=CAM_ASM_000263 /TAXON_ID=37353 /ORGANISM="Rosalina sp." /LENGTH=442 /DNA_ID=CAMNT_0048054603 /DNA_START=265 /DNA_END=1593 /DNA_ORIENTATION=-
MNQDNSKISELSGWPGMTSPEHRMSTSSMLPPTNPSFQRRDSYAAVVHPDRPLDLYGYLCNDDLFLTVDDKSGKLCAMDALQARFSGALQECSKNSNNTASEDNKLILPKDIERHKWEESDPDAAGRSRRPTVSITNPNEISITATEMTEITMTGDFDARELAMMRIAAGNIFDYKTDIIKEEEEHGQDDDHNINDEGDTLFPYVNDDGIEETEEEDDEDEDEEEVAISHISKTAMNDQTPSRTTTGSPSRSSRGSGSSETSTNYISDDEDDEYETGDSDSESDETISEVCTEEDTPTHDHQHEDNYYDNDDQSDDTKDERRERELIQAITVAMSDESNKDIFAARRSTESVINNAELMLNPIYRKSSNDDLSEPDNDDEDTMILNELYEEEEDDENSSSLTSEYKEDGKPKYNLLTVFNESVDDANTKHKSSKRVFSEFVE